MFAELIGVQSLRRIASLAKDPRHFEHATLYLLEHITQFSTQLILIPDEVQRIPELRLTVDTLSDFNLCSRLFRRLYDQHGHQFGMQEIADSLNDQPEVLQQMKLNITENRK
jgi:spore coat polysaccharide biosynthesis protein SpsF (cytidylyltransferase family)